MLADPNPRISISKTRTGYVTEIHPPDSFRLDTLLVRIKPKTTISKVDAAGNRRLYAVDTLPVGLRVTIHGRPDPQKQEFLADKVEIYPEELPQKAIGAGLMDGPTSLAGSGQHWEGIVSADGFRLSVTQKR
ncbi:MAG TPA: hypothetical protein VE178_03920 [Silvibacterium sp.]|nr:hypothetical protein [Silvibacterium sp.]